MSSSYSEPCNLLLSCGPCLLPLAFSQTPFLSALPSSLLTVSGRLHSPVGQTVLHLESRLLGRHLEEFIQIWVWEQKCLFITRQPTWQPYKTHKNSPFGQDSRGRKSSGRLLARKINNSLPGRREGRSSKGGQDDVWSPSSN